MISHSRSHRCKPVRAASKTKQLGPSLQISTPYPREASPLRGLCPTHARKCYPQASALVPMQPSAARELVNRIQRGE
jgi:hypothetical protein